MLYKKFAVVDRILSSCLFILSFTKCRSLFLTSSSSLTASVTSSSNVNVNKIDAQQLHMQRATHYNSKRGLQCICYCKSVRLAVTIMFCVKMAERIVLVSETESPSAYPTVCYKRLRVFPFPQNKAKF